MVLLLEHESSGELPQAQQGRVVVGDVALVYGVGTLRLYIRLVRNGRRLQRPTQDTRQLGGDFVIDVGGKAQRRVPTPFTR